MKLANFSPLNRHLLVEVKTNKSHETTSGIVLPSDYKPEEEQYTVVKLLDWADDVKFHSVLSKSSNIVVDRSMVEEVTFNGNSYHVVLENYVMGIVE